MRKLVAAIDLGTSKVVCLVGEKTDAGIKIIAMNEAPSKGVSRGEVINIQSALDSMLPTIRNVENAIGEQISDVFIGIAGQGVKCIQGTNQTARINPDEYITPEEIEQITEAMYTNFSTDGNDVIHAVPHKVVNIVRLWNSMDNLVTISREVGIHCFSYLLNLFRGYVFVGINPGCLVGSLKTFYTLSRYANEYIINLFSNSILYVSDCRNH